LQIKTNKRTYFDTIKKQLINALPQLTYNKETRIAAVSSRDFEARQGKNCQLRTRNKKG